MSRKSSKKDKKYATFNRRMMAATADSFILAIAAPVFDNLFPVHTESLKKYPFNPVDSQSLLHWLLQVFNDPDFITSWTNNFTMQILAACLFTGIFWHFWAATPGKMLFRIKVVDAKTEAPISDLQIILRLCGYFISAGVLCLGFLWIGIDKRRQGWHDKLADTAVIVLPWKKDKKQQETLNEIVTN